MRNFEKMTVKVCDCGVKRPHVYFYSDPEMGEYARFPYPFISVEGVEIFANAHVTAGLISVEQKEGIVKIAKEAGLQEKMDEEESSHVVPLAADIVAIGALVKK